MRVGIIAPNYYPVHSGNAVTVRRIERHLALLGCEVRVFPVDQLTGEQLLAGLAAYGPDILHAFHGYHGGRVAHALSAALKVPYLVTLTGTDVYQALSDQRSHEVHGALRGAARLVAFHASVKHRLGEHLPSLAERTVVIPQGVDLPPLAVSGSTGSQDDGFTFLLPSGIRPVKNVAFPLRPLVELHERHSKMRLIMVGPVLDPAYATEVMGVMERCPFARYLGAVGHDAMAELYRGADVVLNSSLFEGGMANSVLEALSHARAVLASDIEGNRSIVREGSTGMLYRDAEEFQAKAEGLMADRPLRERLGKNGRELVRDKYPPEKEAHAYLELYREILKI